MSSIAEDLMQAVLARLTEPTSVIPTDGRVRRLHRTVVTRDNAPAIHLIDGEDRKVKEQGCGWERELAFVVRVMVRDDDSFEAADPYKLAVLARLKPDHATYAAYPHNATLEPGDIRPDQEIADQDALGLDMHFRFRYRTGGWGLDVPAS